MRNTQAMIDDKRAKKQAILKLRGERIEREFAERNGEAATPAYGVWQPIETAPKDGTPVLVWNVPLTKYGIAPKEQPEAFVASCDAEWSAEWVIHGSFESSDGYMPTVENPTHWMPRPAGPGVAPEKEPEPVHTNIGYFADPDRPNRHHTIHLCLNGKPACKANVGKNSQFQYCGHNPLYIDCKICQRISNEREKGQGDHE